MEIKLIKPPAGFYTILINQRIQGHDYICMVDTGANTTAISKKILSQLSLPESIYNNITCVRMMGVGGYEVTQRVPIKMRFLGKLMPTDYITVGSFLDDVINKHYPFHINILLGMDILGQFAKLQLDFIEGRMILE